MTNRELICKLAGLLSTLLEETKPGETVIASMIYLAFGSDMDAYRTVTGVGQRSGWLKVTGDTVGLTTAGRAKAKQLEAVMG